MRSLRKHVLTVAFVALSAAFVTGPLVRAADVLTIDSSLGRINGVSNGTLPDGTPFFNLGVVNNVVRFRIDGDFVLGPGDLVKGFGSRGVSFIVANDVNIDPTATIDFSATGSSTAGPGGGFGGSAGTAGSAPGGNGSILGGLGGGGGFGGLGGIGFPFPTSGAGGSTGANGGTPLFGFGEPGSPIISTQFNGNTGSDGVNSGGSGGSAGSKVVIGGSGALNGGSGVTPGGGGGFGGSIGNNGGSGGSGSAPGAGATGDAGFPGQDGGPGIGGSNLGSGTLISGGGGGGSGSRGSGGGGGGSGGGGHGGGGGGGGGGFASGFNFQAGGGGGSGGGGGTGGDGGKGGEGGIGGAGGKGGGAFEIIANGRVTVAGDLMAKGGDGSLGNKPSGGNGFLGSNGGGGANGGNGTGSSAGDGGKGGNGGKGGTGGKGGDGGRGGRGGGGGGGTVKVVGTLVEGSGAVVDTNGGAGVFSGGNGRFIYGRNTNTSFGGAILNSSLLGITGSRDQNPFLIGSPLTPFIPDLSFGGSTGAEIYGLTGLDKADLAATIGPTPDVALAALVRMDVGPAGFSDDYTGFDMLLMVNLTDAPLNNPLMGVGVAQDLLERGWQRNPAFSGGGPVTMATLGAGEVYATLIPEGFSDYTVSADGANWGTFVTDLQDGDVLVAMSTIPGDGNLDGTVNAADYTTWANGFGLPGAVFTTGDYNGDGAANAADYTTWANNFGQMVVAPSNAPAAVPEPSTLVLMTIALLAVFAIGASQRRHLRRGRDGSKVNPLLPSAPRRPTTSHATRGTTA